MPWGSWVTCEETVNGYDVGDDFTRTPPGGTDPGPFTYIDERRRLQKRHGYLFEVPVHGEASAEPITQAGRFAHESVAWDPHTEALYLSEDNFAFPSGFYKYVPPVGPHRAGRLVDGGKLYMLKVKGVTNADLARHQQRGATLQGRVGAHRPAGLRLRAPGAGAPPSEDQRRGDPVRQLAGAGQGGGQVLPARGHDLRQRLGLLHLDPGRPGRRPDPAGHGRRLRQGLRPDLGLRHEEADAAHAVRVAERARCSTSRTTSPPASAARW